MESGEDVLFPIAVGADFVGEAVKISTFGLSLSLMLGQKNAGRVSSGLQFLFWLLFTLCQVKKK